MADRRPLIAGNWKMHKTRAETREFVGALLAGPLPGDEVDLAICPPFTALADAVAACEGSPVAVIAQNMHEADSGAFTGEVSAAMLLDLGAAGALLGHSERRALFGETDEALSRKVPAALEAGLLPVLCVGETEAEREAGETEAVLTRQIESDLGDVSDQGLDDGSLVVAYEPVWAIGTGKTATPQQAQDACALIRNLLAARSETAAAVTRILYGGSVKPDNAAELLDLADVDGALVGGASLEASDFAAIAGAAAA